MSKLLLVLTIAVIGILPLSVSAQTNSPTTPPPGQIVEGIDFTRLAVIGAGVVIGAFAMEVLMVGDIAIVAGAVAGGVLTDWWYRTKDHQSLIPKVGYRAAAYTASPEIRLAMVPRQ
ncbi:MAG: hypothetical protein HN377_00015 [Alphaproteobacteria bacterium]|jgi:hypothetical protein|nr:hypothetical protein [Alphaproteobacteria bacterium]MBT4566049.1 hypothetical protein [Rhodospirillaceae bacterium]MBT7156927.1 hypothetical protein [Rhodospirillaceae bacterium]